MSAPVYEFMYPLMDGGALHVYYPMGETEEVKINDMTEREVDLLRKDLERKIDNRLATVYHVDNEALRQSLLDTIYDEYPELPKGVSRKKFRTLQEYLSRDTTILDWLSDLRLLNTISDVFDELDSYSLEDLKESFNVTSGEPEIDELAEEF